MGVLGLIHGSSWRTNDQSRGCVATALYEALSLTLVQLEGLGKFKKKKTFT
jgi:hypothetical protein